MNPAEVYRCWSRERRHVDAVKWETVAACDKEEISFIRMKDDEMRNAWGMCNIKGVGGEEKYMEYGQGIGG